ncbi:uncharacterized protein LOC110736702 [Chenopodium quinoa]|uniref:uncharacterized protein LOC110736702 n=1 Tax=Chenopodium quinoa TaxID=63459 RepID=UPI000B779586|nr:uncharacterized protein LOC110736702 [Chenopodium quinoa]
MEKSYQPVEEMKMLVGMEVDDEESAAVNSTDDVSSFMDEFNRYCTLSTQQETYQNKFEEASRQGIQKSPNELYWETVGGHSKKGRVKGLGQSEELYYDNQKGRVLLNI